jgi:hypothetical protein
MSGLPGIHPLACARLEACGAAHPRDAFLRNALQDEAEECRRQTARGCFKNKKPGVKPGFRTPMSRMGWFTSP